MVIRTVKVHGKIRWMVDFGLRDGRRLRKIYKSKTAAESAAGKDKDDTEAIGKRWADLAPQARVDAMAVLEEMRKAGVALRAVWEAYKADKVGAVHKPASEAIDEYLLAKERANRRKNYVDGLKRYLGMFIRGREKLAVHQFTTGDVEAWFAKRKETPASQASDFFRISGWFAFCARRGWCKTNPCDSMERVTVIPRTPQILTPTDAAKALGFIREQYPRFLPYLALGLFCGVRPEEIDRLTWASVHLKRKLITLDAIGTKVQRRRVVPVPANAVRWLEIGGDLPLPKMTKRRTLRKLRDHLGLKAWPADLLRHTAASYLLARHNDAPKVARWLGNSPAVLLAHYYELVSAADARAFFALKPQ